MSVHFLKERKVNFYADRLNITHGYLSSTVKSVSGKTPLDWIEEYVLAHKDTKKRRFFIQRKTLCIFVSLCLKLYQQNNYYRGR